ncbi:MAG: flippase [Candidatus Caenarcaniphilales bacterium]|nr:flippase [Candidatus Caenarcaniphilales bacterium]
MLIELIEKFRERLADPEKRKVLFNALWLILDRLLQLGLGLVVSVFLARYLGPEDFGLYNFIIALVVLASLLANLGLNELGVKYLVKEPDQIGRSLGSISALKFAGGILIYLLSFLVLWSLRPSNWLALSLMVIMGSRLIFQTFDAIDLWYQAKLKSREVVLVRNGAYLIGNLLKLGGIYWHAPLIFFAWMEALQFLIMAIGYIWAYQSHSETSCKLKHWSWDLGFAKEILKESFPMILSSLVIVIYMKIDQIMLGYLAGDREVGIYSAAAKLSEGWYFIPVAIVNSFFPTILETQREGLLYWDKLQKLFDLMAAIGYLAGFSISLLAGWIINLLYGADYAGASMVLAVHIWTGLFASLGIARKPWIIAEGQMKFLFATNLCGAILNALLNLLLIPRFGALGTAFATALAQFVASYLSNLFFLTTRPLFWSQTKALVFHRFWGANPKI